jgi:hypothetical protein
LRPELDRAGKKRWKTIPEDRAGDDLEIHQDQVAVVPALAIKKVEDADEEEWHIPMSNLVLPPFTSGGLKRKSIGK